MKKGGRIALDIALSIAILAASWLLRAPTSDAFVTWDEPAWVYRSVKFLQALSHGDLAGTLLTGHPGVLTMWSGALGLTWHRLVSGTVTEAQLAAIAALPTLEVHDAATLRQLTALLPMAKSGLLVAHALIALAIYWLLVRLLDRRYALLGSALLLLDPYYLGLSRVLHIDALASGLMLISLLAILNYALRGGQGMLLLSGAAAGMAFLSKAYGALLAPTATLILLYANLRAPTHPGRRLARALGDALLWGALACVVLLLLWPAMWVTPLQALRAVVGLSLEYAADPGDATAGFFRGQASTALPLTFYPTTMLFRTTPLVLIGVVLSLLGLLWEEREAQGAPPRRATILGVLLLGVLYLALISISRKKFDRYTLPALLGADLLAALGLLGALELLTRPLRRGEWQRLARRIAAPLLALAVVLAQGYLLLGHLAPAHYLAYYNPWAGGPSKAVQAIPVGWGEGIEEAAAYLAAKPQAEEITVATWAVAGLAPIFPGRVITLTAETIPLADYVLLYIGDIQKQSPLTQVFYGRQEPEYVARLNGVEYAWLYPNMYYVQLTQEIAQAAGPNDLILLNTRSAFERNYHGELPWYVIEGETEAQVAAQLAEAVGPPASAPRHIFYLEYQNGKLLQTLIRRQLAQNGLFLWSKPFAYGTISCYRVAENAAFRQVLPTVEAAIDYGHQLMLVGYGLADTQVQYRQELGVGLKWRALRQMERDYHIFLHLVDEEGRMWGQRDLPLQDERLARTTAWPPGSEHLTNCAVPLEAGIPPGQYWLAVGIYRLEDLTRLDIIAEDESKLGTEFNIGPITVITPTVPPRVEDLPIQTRTEITLDRKIEILGYSLSSDHPQSGEEVAITLFWRCLEPLARRYDLGLRLGRDGGTAGFRRVPPVGSHHPTDRWVPQEVFRYTYSLPIAPDAASGSYQVYLNFYESEGSARLVPEDVLLTSLQVEHRERLFEIPAIGHPMRVRVGEEIEFLGYDLPQSSVHAGGTLPFTLYWRALRPIDRAYTVFTHLLDGQEIVRGQKDSVPAGGQRPTTSWAAGEVIVDPYEMPVDADAPPGPHRVEIGLYDPTTGERPPMTRKDGSPIHERRVFFEEIITVAD